MSLDVYAMHVAQPPYLALGTCNCRVRGKLIHSNHMTEVIAAGNRFASENASSHHEVVIRAAAIQAHKGKSEELGAQPPFAT